ncbi:MAG TPA: hypothetical protein DCE23_07995 [Firmicutes bacterium]|nr:hypothetical protein [Bacillota bacterium]
MNETEKNVTAKLYYINKDVISSVKKKFIALDFETTGIDSRVDRVVEIGAVIYENGKIIKTFDKLVNPNKLISPEASKVSKITNEMIENSPSETDLYPEFIEFLGNALNGEIYICAHNARFEIGFITETLNRLGYKGSFKFLDTLYISKILITGLKDYKQDTVASHFNIVNRQSHRACTDAETCGNILLELIKIAENK